MALRVVPVGAPSVDMANQPVPAELASVDVLPYLVAHQDYAQALTSNPEMHFTQVALAVPGGSR